MNFSEKLQNLRKEQKLSQEQLASMLDVSRQSVSKWESGQTYPEMDKLLTMCKIFSCTLEELTNDEIKEISKEKKNNSNIIDELLNNINQSIKMFNNMTIKEIIKCLLKIIAIVLVLLAIYIPYTYLSDAIGNIFLYFGNIGYYIKSILKDLLTIVYVIFSIIIFFYIYKTRFLDKYTTKEVIVKEEKEKPHQEKQEINNNPIIEKEVIVNPKHQKNSSKLLNILDKILIFFIKTFVFILTLFPVITLVISVALLVINVIILIKGITFIGTMIILISIILFAFLVIKIFYNFIFNCKTNFKISFIILITSLILLGVGTGITSIEITKINIKNEVNYNLKTTSYKIQMTENMVFSRYIDIKYVEDNSKEYTDYLKIEIEHFDVQTPNIEQYMYYDYNFVDIYNDEDWIKILQYLLDDLKDNTISKYNIANSMRITVTTTKKNIDKLSSNRKKVNEIIEENENQELVDYYENIINELESELNEKEEIITEQEQDNNNLETKIDEQEQLLEELQYKLEQYKELSE